MEIIDDIKESFSMFTDLYDILRLVDPINKKSIIIEENEYKEIEGSCYSFWKKDTFCDNCIAMRAYYEKDTCVRLEFKDENILLLIAVPINLQKHHYILEIIKNISQESNFLKANTQAVDTITQILNGMTEKFIKDEITGTFNKRYINERLIVDINTHLNKKLPLSVIMTTIDNLKYVKDIYGQGIGEKVLKDFAEVIRSSIDHSKDWVGRYSGETFLIVLNNTPIDKAYKTVEKIRRHIENTHFEYGEIKVSITSSFGVTVTYDKMITIDELIASVDEKLYRAKKKRPNNIIKED
ncbi:GGDEF domain-containing protein [Cellulosilyticum sp. I15G10I2]|uniref:GGDEF domain-containing protein n=1 Tax=Cellulosilyticum sp. I15G10I2 TaxID=1892843 RepID=UPI0009F6EC4D|nr:GGDEF domain-containing protein [Cellulosilyticum sp. I15G10I2]